MKTHPNIWCWTCKFPKYKANYKCYRITKHTKNITADHWVRKIPHGIDIYVFLTEDKNSPIEGIRFKDYKTSFDTSRIHITSQFRILTLENSGNTLQTKAEASGNYLRKNFNAGTNHTPSIPKISANFCCRIRRNKHKVTIISSVSSILL